MIASRAQALLDVLADVELFSRHMVGTAVPRYQLERAGVDGYRIAES
jgi:hypothetical protein